MCTALLPTEELIDNMNDGSQFIPNIHGRAGSWQGAHDTTPNVMMFPPDGTFAMSNTNDPCRLLAVRVYGGPFTLWGALVDMGLGAPYNASAYRGVSFWAKVGATSTTGFRLTLPDKDTDPAGGLCSTAAGAPANGCYDHWGRQLFFTTSWTKYTVRFSELSQLSWGSLVSQFDPTTLYRLEWEIPAGATFDLWIDDVSFLTQ